MWYMPYLRVRHAVLVYTYFAVGFSLAAIALRFWPGVMHSSGREILPSLTIPMLLSGSAALVGGLATVLGLSLAAENDRHLEVAWTKPISREGYALGIFAVDIGAMVACILLTAVCGAIVADVYTNAQIVSLSLAGNRTVHDLAFCGFPLLVYAWVAALSASIKRNRGAIAGLFWPVMIALAAIPHIPLPPIAAAAPLFGALNLVNPVDLFTSGSSGLPQVEAWNFAWGWLVAAALLAAAIYQWRRLQL